MNTPPPESFENPVTLTSLAVPEWLDGAQFAASLTFDFDAEAGAVGDALDAGSSPRRIGRISAGTFGAQRGVDRVLDVLADFDLRATFYVPGLTVELHPDSVRRIADLGHEIALHGFAHRRYDRLSRDAQYADLHAGIAAHEACVGRPRGFRAPGWEMTPETLRLLAEAGLSWDSSLMGDDRPHRVHVAGADLCELPVHWTLDDWPFLGFNGDGGHLSSTSVPLSVWLAEADSAAYERRHVTYTMHPEVIGRGYAIKLLVDLIEGLLERQAAILTHGELVASYDDRNQMTRDAHGPTRE